MNEQRLRDFIQKNMETPHDLSIKIDTNDLCNKLIKLMFDEKFLDFYNDLLGKEMKNNNYIMKINKSVKYDSIKKLMEKSIENGQKYIPRFLSSFTKQWKKHHVNQNKYLPILRKLERNKLLKPVGEYFWKCDSCKLFGIFAYEKRLSKCPKCGSKPVIISQNKFPTIVKKCLNKNQFLEMFARDSLEKAGWNLLYYQSEDNQRVMTSLQFPGDPDTVEIDSAATYKNNLILCEAKNVKKLTPNNIDKKISKITSFIKILEEELDDLPNIYFVFIINGDVDKNAKKYNNNERNNLKIKVYGKDEIVYLPDKLEEIKK